MKPPASGGFAGEFAGRRFQDASADVIGALLARYGAAHLETIEDSFQEAMIRAVEVWPFAGVPDRPRAWLYTVARNRLIDSLRREKRRARRELEFSAPAPGDLDSVFSPGDRLRLICFCCHPALRERARIALTLQLAGGFRTPQIARALLMRPPAAEKLLQRAKKKLRDAGVEFLSPESGEIGFRLRDVLSCIYLIFNEGLNAHAGDRQFSETLCAEALRLTFVLLSFSVPSRERPENFPAVASVEESATTEVETEIQALGALICLQSARLPARAREGPDWPGHPVLLRDQDRSLWDRALLARGFACLRRAGRGARRSSYHFEAGIAACHASAPSFEATDWKRIVGLYDELLELRGGAVRAPVVALNRAAALLYADSAFAAEEALNELERSGGADILRDYHLLPATRAAVCEGLGRTDEARRHNARACELARLEPERRLLRARSRAGKSGFS